MKVDINVEFDTDKPQDLELIEDVLYYIQDIKEILETKQQNLNLTPKTTRAHSRARSLPQVLEVPHTLPLNKVRD